MRKNYLETLKQGGKNNSFVVYKMIRIVIKTLTSFIFHIFMGMFHYKHKYIRVCKYYKDNNISGIHDISAYIVYKCEFCNNVYTKCVYKAKGICAETSYNKIVEMLNKHNFLPYMEILDKEEYNLL